MKFSSDVPSLLKAVRAIERKHPSGLRRDINLRMKASANGVKFETNQSSAFVPAQVGIAGACVVPRNIFTKVLATFPRTKPITIEMVDGRLSIGTFRLNMGAAFVSRENERQDLF